VVITSTLCQSIHFAQHICTNQGAIRVRGPLSKHTRAPVGTRARSWWHLHFEPKYCQLYGIGNRRVRAGLPLNHTSSRSMTLRNHERKRVAMYAHVGAPGKLFLSGARRRKPTIRIALLAMGVLAILGLPNAANAQVQPPQACCLPDGSCIDVDHNQCVAMGGDPQGPGIDCTNAICHPIKWSQPPTFNPDSPHPECFWGWDEYSVYGSPQWIVADDWLCDNERPVSNVHWWGSYLGWDAVDPPPDVPQAFHIGIWTDVPAGVNEPFSHPGVMIWEWIAPYPVLNERPVACDFHPEFMVTPESCYRYDFDIPEPDWFIQEPACNVYWISIAAINEEQSQYPWGWKTRRPEWNDDAVRIYWPTAPMPGMLYELGEPIETLEGSWDMAFVLTTKTEELPEACCLPDGSCTDVGHTQCVALGGDPQGPGTDCMNVVCYPLEPLPAPSPYDVKKNRYISLNPNNPVVSVALRLNCSVCPGQDMWIAAPTLMSGEWVSRVTNAPVYRLWSENVIHVSDAEIGPGAQYEIRATKDGVHFTAPAVVSTIDPPSPHHWADVAGRCDTGTNLWSPPQGVVDFMDVWAAIDKFRGVPTAPHMTWVDLAPEVPQFSVDLSDIAAVVDGFIGLPYPVGWETGMCSCTNDADCDDGLFCNGIEACNGIWCEPGADPCPNQGCDEAAGACVPCLANTDCDDGLFCNGAETCQGGFCRPGSYPCGNQACDEALDSCVTLPTSPLIALEPVGASGGHIINGNEIILYGGGQQVTVELFLSGWSPYLLSTYQGTVTPSSYLGETARPQNPGVDLVPVGWPDDPDSGAFVDNTRSDFAFRFVSEVSAVSRPTPQYAWGAATLSNFVADSGTPAYAGTLIVDVPAAARGTYTIHFNPDPKLTWLTQGCANVAGLKVGPALIRVEVPQACCLPDGSCTDVDHNQCVALGGDPQGPGTDCTNAICHPIKWSQPPTFNPDSPHPECFWGWDEYSVYGSPQWIVADDWLCDNEKPVNNIHWWGSYLGWDLIEPPPVVPQAFHIGIWTDVPPGVDQPFSHPGVMIWEWIAPYPMLNERPVACDFHPQFMNSPESCYRYDFDIPEPEWFFQEPACTIYWVSISAIYQEPTPFPWGWKTRRPEWNVDAVRILWPTAPMPGMPYEFGEPIETPEGSWDMAFVLTSKEVPLLPPGWCEDTCYQGTTNLGIPCSTDAECSAVPGAVCGLKSRYISLTPQNPIVPTSLRVEVVSAPQFPGIVGDVWSAGPEQAVPDPPGPSLRGAPLQCPASPHVQTWTPGCLHLWGTALVPGSTYEVRHCDAAGNCSAPLRIATGKWGDVVAPFGGATQPNFGDVSAILDKFRGTATAPSTPRTDLVGPGSPGSVNLPNQLINFADVSAGLDAFRGITYPYAAGTCP
jgi:hypothetical protein